jgi:hypothetical protein
VDHIVALAPEQARQFPREWVLVPLAPMPDSVDDDRVVPRKPECALKVRHESLGPTVAGRWDRLDPTPDQENAHGFLTAPWD